MVRDARESAFVKARFPDSIFYWTLEMQDDQVGLPIQLVKLLA